MEFLRMAKRDKPTKRKADEAEKAKARDKAKACKVPDKAKARDKAPDKDDHPVLSDEEMYTQEGQDSELDELEILESIPKKRLIPDFSCTNLVEIEEAKDKVKHRNNAKNFEILGVMSAVYAVTDSIVNQWALATEGRPGTQVRELAINWVDRAGSKESEVTYFYDIQKNQNECEHDKSRMQGLAHFAPCPASGLINGLKCRPSTDFLTVLRESIERQSKKGKVLVIHNNRIPWRWAAEAIGRAATPNRRDVRLRQEATHQRNLLEGGSREPWRNLPTEGSRINDPLGLARILDREAACGEGGGDDENRTTRQDPKEIHHRVNPRSA